MKRRRALQLLGSATGAVALSPADLLFPGTGALTGISDAAARDTLEALRGEDPVRSEVRTERGGPRLFVNDSEVVPLFGLSTKLLPTVDNMRRMGIDLLQPIIGLQSFWTGPGEYDWTAHDEYFGRLLTIHPDAMFFPRVQLQSPRWWKDAHPEELIAYGLPGAEGTFNRIEQRGMERMEGGHYFTEFYGEGREASFASEVWKRDTAALLRAYIEHIESSPLVSRLMGYFIAHGRTSEWNYYGGDFLPDYSAPMQAAAGPIPPPRERLYSSNGLLRDPEEEEAVMGYYRRFHRTIANTVTETMRVVKEACGRRVIAGTFFGYIMESPRIQEGGYLYPHPVLDSPDIDLIASPYTYQNTNDETKERWESDMIDGAGNWLGRARGVAGDAAHRVMLESLKRRGKLFVSEIDPSTYLDERDGWRGIGGSGSGTEEGSVKILRRDFGKVFADGIGGWLFDFGPSHGVDSGWYGSDRLIDGIARYSDLFSTHLDRDLASVGEVLFVADTDSAIATRHWQAERPWPGQGIRYTDFFNHWFLDTQNRTVQRLGAPVRYLHRSDLTAGDARAARLILMPYAFLLEASEVDRLRAALQGSGATVVWYYAPGFIQPERLNLEQMERLTGFRYRVNDVPGPLLIDAAFPGDEVLEQRFGVKSPQHYAPRFIVTGEDAEILGTWADGRNTTAFARKSMDGWTSVYVGTAPLTAQILRRLATDAGATLWSSKADIVNATEGAAMLVATEAGSRTLVVPRPMRAVDGGLAQTRHDLDLEFGDVRLFVAE